MTDRRRLRVWISALCFIALLIPLMFVTIFVVRFLFGLPLLQAFPLVKGIISGLIGIALCIPLSVAVALIWARISALFLSSAEMAQLNKELERFARD